GDEAVQLGGGSVPAADADRRHLWHEFPLFPGTQLALWLRDFARPDVRQRNRTVPLFQEARLDLRLGRLLERDCRKFFSGGSRGRAAAGQSGIGKRELAGDLDALGLVLRAGGSPSFGRAAAKIV